MAKEAAALLFSQALLSELPVCIFLSVSAQFARSIFSTKWSRPFEEGRTKSVSEIITSSGIFSLGDFQSLVHISPPVPQSCLFAFFHNCLPQRGLLHFSVSKNYVLIFVLSKNFVGDPGTLEELLLKAGGASDLALAPLLVQLLLRLLLQSPDVVHRHPVVSVHPAKHLHKKELFFYFFLNFSSTCL